MNKNIVPLLSNRITFHPINKNDYFIHQITFNHRIKISLNLYNFILLIDNNKSLDCLVDEYNLKYHSILTYDFAYDFLYNKLAKYGIIETDMLNIQTNSKPSYIQLSFIVFNEKTVSKFTKYLKYLFFPKVIKILLTITILLLSICFYFYNREIFYTSITKSDWILFFFLSFIGITFHEFGHASASQYFGAKNGGIGGGFYLFMPVYFSDVTDIWKLPKHQRIIVNLAGMYFEFVYVIFLISIGLLFKLQLLVVLSCIFSVSILHSLNPFARSDGYWVLSDAIDKPNLMKHGYIKIKQLFKSKKGWKKIDYFLLLYGLLSYSFIVFLIYFVVIKNPNSILYFPQNIKRFAINLYTNSRFSLFELSKLFIPILFFYVTFGFIRKFISEFRKK